MKKKFKRKKLTKMLSLTLTLAMVLTMMPWMSVPVRAADLLTATVDSTVHPHTTIINGNFATAPWMDFKYNGTRYTNKSNGLDNIVVKDEDVFFNPVDEGWNTSERKLQSGSLFEELGGGAGFEEWHNRYLTIDGLCVEMNSKTAAVLYQDLTTYPGDIIQWTLKHGLRGFPSHPNAGDTADNTQSIRVEIGARGTNPQGTNSNISANKAVYKSTGVTGDTTYGYGNTGELLGLSITKTVENASKWHTAKGVYIIPEGQNVTRFAFISENTNKQDEGNYLDDVTFSTLVGSLKAVAQPDGSVIVTGYWGDSGSKKLKVDVGDTTVEVNMSSVSNKSFSVTIPSSTINNSTDLKVYHEDYPVAKESIKIAHGSHDWKYEAGTGDNANKLIAKCTKDSECSIENSKDGLPLTISATSPTINDGSKVPTITYGNPEEQAAWTAAGLKLPDTTGDGAPVITKKYYNRNEDNTRGTEITGGAPEAVGKYIVDVEVDYGPGNKSTFSLPYRVTKPLGDSADITDTNVSGGNKTVTVTGMKVNQEYIVTTKASADDLTDDDWDTSKLVQPNTEGNGEITGLSDETTYYVYTRKKETEDKDPGPAVLVNSCKTNFGQPNNNKTGYTIKADGTIKIDEGYEVFKNENCTDEVIDGAILEEGKTYYVRKKADPGQGGAGAGEPIPFEYKPLSAPTGLGSENPQCIGGDDGKITGLDPSMEYEYQYEGDDDWSDVPKGATEIPGLRQGKVKVRIKGSTPNNAGPIREITIGDGTLPEELNTAKVEPEDGGSSYKLTGVTDDMQYSIDGGENWIDVPTSETEVSGIPVGTVVLVRMINGNPNDILILTAGTKPAHRDNGGGHVHEFEWGNWERVTKDENGTMVYQCKLCGYVLEKEYIPAYAYTCLTESEHVLKTPQNGSVICEMGRWNAYPRWFFEKLATRPDVNITLKFLYQHKQYTVSIPAGTKIDTEHDWYGPLKICSLYQFEVK